MIADIMASAPYQEILKMIFAPRKSTLNLAAGGSEGVKHYLSE